MTTTTTSSPAATPHLLTPPATLSAPMYSITTTPKPTSPYFAPTKTPPKSTPRSTPTTAKSTPTTYPTTTTTSPSEPSAPTPPLLPSTTHTTDSPPSTPPNTADSPCPSPSPTPSHHRPRTLPPHLTIPPPSPTPPTPPPPTSTNPAISQITPTLFLGDMTAGTNPELLQEYGITHVLSLVPGDADAESGSSLSLPLMDTEEADLLRILPRATAWVSAAVAEGRVLVHCRAGVSRGAAVVVACVMVLEGWGVERALECVRARRRVDPNLGFLGQLKRWEEMLREGEVGGGVDGCCSKAFVGW